MPLLIQMLWLLVLTLFGAREQVRFSQRPRPAIIHIPPNQGLFGLLATFGIPSMVATGLFFPSWSLLFVVSPEMILPLGWSLALGLMITATSALLLWVNYRWAKAFWPRSTLREHSALSLMGYLGRWRVCALPRASRENRNLQRVLVAQGSTTD